jgi:hypothetical protein
MKIIRLKLKIIKIQKKLMNNNNKFNKFKIALFNLKYYT